MYITSENNIWFSLIQIMMMRKIEFKTNWAVEYNSSQDKRGRYLIVRNKKAKDTNFSE